MNLIKRWGIKKAINYLTKSHSGELLKIGEDRLIPVFQDAAGNVPAYREFLKEKGVDLSEVNDVESFKRLVPIIDKSIFSKYEIYDLCRGKSLGGKGKLSNMTNAATSSGMSSEFSYALSGKKALNNFKFMADLLLDYIFNTSKRRTFFINADAMGVRMHTDLFLAETSVRPDMVLALIKKFASSFDQIILMGNTYFVKKVIEDGIEHGIDWKNITVHLVIGEDWFPENYRTYLARLLGIDFDRPEKGMIISTMGISELGTTLFQETYNKVCIRRLAEENKELRYALFGKGTDICPILFHYHPYQIFLEEIDGELVFTTLARDAAIPLVRYRSGDRGRIYTYNAVKAVLDRFDYKERTPELKLPLVAVMGRSGSSLAVAREEILTLGPGA